MNRQTSFSSFNVFAAFVICLTAFSAASAATLSEQLTRSLVVSNLSARLKTDLAQTDVSVKLSNLKQQKVSADEIEVNGSALAVLVADNNQLPIHFAAKIDVAQKSISEISYDFVGEEIASDYAPTANEEVLMKTLLKQISKDYNTDNIVIALDGVDGKFGAASVKEFTGVGEVRIGDMEWNRIEFNVVIGENGKASKVFYDLKK